MSSPSQNGKETLEVQLLENYRGTICGTSDLERNLNLKIEIQPLN